MLNFLLKIGCVFLILIILVTVCAVLGLLMIFSPRAAAAEGESRYSPILIAPAHPDAPQATAPQGLYYQVTLRAGVFPQGCPLILAGDPTGRLDTKVDDTLTLTTLTDKGMTRTWQHDYRQGPAVEPLPPQDLSAALGSDLSVLTVTMQDLTPPTFGNSEVWLIPCPGSPGSTPQPDPVQPTHSPLPAGSPAASHVPGPGWLSSPTPQATPSLTPSPTGHASIRTITAGEPPSGGAQTTLPTAPATSGTGDQPGPAGLVGVLVGLVLCGGLLTFALWKMRARSSGAVPSTRTVIVQDMRGGPFMQLQVRALPVCIAANPLRQVASEEEADYILREAAEAEGAGPMLESKKAENLPNLRVIVDGAVLHPLLM